MITELVIRPSSLPAWNDCPRRTAARLFPELVTGAGYTLRAVATHVGATVGSGVHAGAATTLKAKMETGDLGPEDVAVETAFAEFDARAEESGVVWDATTDNRNAAQVQIRKMTRAHRKHVAPEIQPVVVEERLEADVGDGFIISGQLDALAMEPDSRLRDLKTGVTRRANGAQYGSYSMLFRAHGYEVGSIVEDYVKRVRSAEPQPEPESHLLPIDAAEQDAVEAIADVKRSVGEFLARAADLDGPPPHTAFRANPASMLCSERYCPAHGSDFCRSHRGAR